MVNQVELEKKLCDLFKVDTIIESGVCNGRSTEMWAKWIGGENVTGIDWKILDTAILRTAKYGVTLYDADATAAMKHVLIENATKRIGVFIDGPKGQAALDLAEFCLSCEQVAFVGVHDMSKLLNGEPHEARAAMEAMPGETWFTDAEWFVDAYKHLDGDESHWDEEQGTKWKPYYRLEKGKPPIPRGSYGHTIGFITRLDIA